MGFITSALAKAGFNLVRRGTVEAAHRISERGQIAQVIPLPTGLHFPMHGDDQHASDVASQPAARKAVTAVFEARALQDDPKLVTFREYDHRGTGYHDGSAAPNCQALKEGKERLLATFDNTVDHMMAERRVLIGEAEMRVLDMGQQVRSLGETKMRKFIQQTQNDIEELQRQRDLAEQGKGWYREPLGRYSQGYSDAWNDADGEIRPLR